MRLAFILLFVGMMMSVSVFAGDTAASAGPWGFLPETVASMDGEKISRDEFLRFLVENTPPGALAGFDERKRELYAREVLQKFVNQKILSTLAAADGYPASSALLLADMRKWLADSPKEQRESFERYLRQKGIGLEEYCDAEAAKLGEGELRRRAVELWSKQCVEPRGKVTEEEVKEFYGKSGDMVKVSQILVRPLGTTKEAKDAARRKAEEILKRLRKDPSLFDKIASRESDCTRENGDLGAFGRGEMVEEFDKVAFNMKKGEISDVFETIFGFHIIRLDNAWKRPLPPFDAAVASRIRQTLIAIKNQDIIINLLRDAKKKHVVKVFF